MGKLKRLRENDRSLTSSRTKRQPACSSSVEREPARIEQRFEHVGESMSLVDAAQWISLERLCFPFLIFQLQAGGSDHDYWLRVQPKLRRL
jgi:hypothetical protein